jgi:hypothetical protein
LAKRHAIAFKHATVQQLRAVREAGRLLSLVQRSHGGRPQKNSSRSLTSYQLALTQAGISRQTASVWRQVAEIPDDEFERFVADAGVAFTIAELLRRRAGGSERLSIDHAITLQCSDADYAEFTRQLAVLRAASFSRTPGDAVSIGCSRR